MKVLLLGKKGMLGSAFFKAFAGKEDCQFYATDKEILDLCDFEKTDEYFKKISPDLVLNCSAYTDVDGAEENESAANKLNAEIPEFLAKLCKRENSILIHFSTDYVFDGTKSDGYLENDNPKPINIYGKTKLAGENLIKTTMDHYYIIRTSWLFGPNGINFVDKILDLSKNKKNIDIINDQFGSPTYTKDLVEAVIQFFLSPFLTKLSVEHAHDFPVTDANTNLLPFGIYHLTNDGICSWFEFAKYFLNETHSKVIVNPVSSDNFKTIAERPKFSILINSKLPHSRSWQDAVKVYLK